MHECLGVVNLHFWQNDQDLHKYQKFVPWEKYSPARIWTRGRGLFNYECSALSLSFPCFPSVSFWYLVLYHPTSAAVCPLSWTRPLFSPFFLTQISDSHMSDWKVLVHEPFSATATVQAMYQCTPPWKLWEFFEKQITSRKKKIPQLIAYSVMRECVWC